MTSIGGAATEWTAPYTSYNGDVASCSKTGYESVVTTNGPIVLATNDNDAVMTHLTMNGPLAIAADASSWHSYGGGIFDGCDYDANIDLDHAIVHMSPETSARHPH